MWVEINGTSLMGRIEADYAELVRAFGEPNSEGDTTKSDAEWAWQFEDGTVATIYNWKNGKNYCGEYGQEVENIKNWNIGGYSKHAVECVLYRLGRTY